jgi:hypothetical protein
VWTVQLRGAHAALFAFRRACGGDAEFRERDLLAEEDEWRRLVVIECSESIVHTGQIGVVVGFTRRQEIWNFAFRTERGPAAGLGDHQWRGPGKAGHWLSELKLLERRKLNAFGYWILKGEIEPALCFGQPAEPTV